MDEHEIAPGLPDAAGDSGRGGSGGDGQRDVLRRALRRVRRRLLLDRLLRALSVDAIVFACAYAALLAVERSSALGWNPLALLAGCAGAWIATSVMRSCLLSRVGERSAAATIDARLALEERVSSAVYLSGHPAAREDPEWARLVVEDSVRHLRGADIARHFPLKPPRIAWLVALPAASAAAVWLWMPGLDLLGREAERRIAEAMRRDVAEVQKDVASELARLEAAAEERKDPELASLLVALEKALEKASEEAAVRAPKEGERGSASAEEAKKRALAELGAQHERLRRELDSQRKFQEARKTLEQLERASLKDLKDLKDGTRARQLLGALKRRDLRSAGKQLDDLEKQLRDLDGKARSPAGLSQDEKKRLEELAEELARLSRSLEGAGASRGLAGGLEKAAAGLEGLDLEQALDGLQLFRKDLDELAKSLEQLAVLEDAKDLLEKAQDELAKLDKHQCPNCGKPRVAQPGRQPGGS
jgi:hypothetical protein